jgi:hypothetical protein
MPKLKEVLKNVEKGTKKAFEDLKSKTDHVVGDKYERAEDCFDKLHSAGVKLCFKDSGQEIISYSQIKDIAISRIDMINEKVLQYCLEEFANKGILKCEDVPLYKPIENLAEYISETAKEAAQKAQEELTVNNDEL